jgi:biopolymer transport protein ExbD
MAFLASCTNKKLKPVVAKNSTKNTVTLHYKKKDESIVGLYSATAESGTDCHISIAITATKKGYLYLLKTDSRNVKGKATVTINASGEKYITLEGLQWDEYEGDISNEEDTNRTKTVEIPIGIDASYIKDTLTIQNYGNAMNYYTKISECGAKYIQLVKK